MDKKNKYIASLISKMTTEEKVGALLTLGFTGTLVTPNIYEAIEKFHCGGLRLTPHARKFGSYIDPKSGEIIVKIENTKGYRPGLTPPSVTPNEFKKILMDLQEMALKRKGGIPLHYSYDQEGGASSANYNFGGVNIFPKPMGIRSTNDPKLAYEVALAISRQSRAVGFNWIHSPVLDVNVDPNNPEINTRAYSDKVDEVIEYAVESCRGFQDGGVIATGKHFPGRGDSDIDAHFEMPVINVDKKIMFDRELLPYKILIEEGLLPSVMLAHSIFPAFDDKDVATVSKPIITGVLREKLNFKGVITTDSMTMGGIAVRYGVPNACAMSLEAGADLVLMKAETKLVDETFNAILDFVDKGRISKEELDDKVYRVLNTKYEYGLFTDGSIWDEEPEEVINDPQIIHLSKLVARRSVLIPRDRKDILPLGIDEKILVAEQIVKGPNNINWHPGMLFKDMIKYNRDVHYLELAFNPDDLDKKNLAERIDEFDTIVVTDYFVRGKVPNNYFAEEVIKLAKEKNKKVVVIANTPYAKFSVPDSADTVVLTFATSPDNIEVVAGVLFGKIKPEGVWPIEYKLPE